MDQFLIEIATQVPNLGALIFLVRWFLAHLANRDATLREIQENCHSVQRESVEAMKDTARTLGIASKIISDYNEEQKYSRMSSVSGIPAIKPSGPADIRSD